MKKIIFVIVIILVIVGAVMLFSKSNMEKVMTEQPKERLDENVENRVAASVVNVDVTTLSPNVTIKEVNVANEKSVPTSASTTYGATIKTGSVGRALVEAPEKRMVIDYGTEITLAPESTKETSKIKLVSGSVWSQVEKIFEKGQFHEIQTQNAVAAVRGTSFSVSYVGGKTIVLVTEGTVAVTPIDGATGQSDPTKTVLATAGKKAVVADSGIVLTALTAADRNSNWYKFNVGSKAAIKSAANTPAPKVQAVVPPTNSPTSPTSPTPKPPASSSTENGSTGGTVIMSNNNGGTNGGEPAPSNSESAVIKIKSVSPAQAYVQSYPTITISGSGFKKAVSVTISSGENEPYEINGYKIVSDNTITFTLPKNATPGSYDVAVSDANEDGDSLVDSLMLN